MVIASSALFNNSITFVHNLSCCRPEYDFIILFKAINDNRLLSGIYDIRVKTVWQYHRNQKLLRDGIFNSNCTGIIIYDDRTENCCMMYSQMYNCERYLTVKLPVFALPGFSVNASIGHFLQERSKTITIDGYLTQELHQNALAYNVEAYINITQDPNSSKIVLGTRFDSMMAECPGDSGCGNGIIMGIAKYMEELNQSGIKPKHDVTFLLDNNEENGCRGAEFYSNTHKNDKITLWIGTDQLGFTSGYHHMVYKNPEHMLIGNATSKILDYEGKTTYLIV